MIWLPVSWFAAHLVVAGRLAPLTANDCGGYAGSVKRISVPRASTWASLSLDGSPEEATVCVSAPVVVDAASVPPPDDPQPPATNAAPTSSAQLDSRMLT